jgi:hypothetical protein
LYVVESLLYKAGLYNSYFNLAKKSRVASLGNIPIKVSNNLFDKLVQPVLTYNAEISFMDSYLTYYRAKRRAEINNKEIDHFTFIDKTPCQRIHLNFCKFTLGYPWSIS